MGYLIVGIAVFAGVHLFSMLLPDQRNALKARMGEGPYKGVYSLISLAGLALMIWGFWTVSSDPAASSVVYEPAPWARHVTMLLVLLGFISLSGFHGKGYLKQLAAQSLFHRHFALVGWPSAVEWHAA